MLRLRFVSFKDVANQSIPNTLLYVKKLTQAPTNKETPMVLEESNPALSVVLSLNQTFDWRLDAEEYCQILFLQSSKTQTTPIADIVLRRNHLLDLVNDSRHNKQLQAELLCTTMLERGYQFAFSLQLIEHLTSTLHDDQCSSLTNSSNHHHHHSHDKPSSRQEIKGHLMCVTQFNHPVYCAICNKFVWGLHRQGYECQSCSLVTHRKCRHQIPFWCRKSADPETNLLNGNHRFKIHIPHVFRAHEAPLIRSILTSDRGHCSHCGSQIVRHALKCTQCHFVIHEHCQSNVPDMCTVPYLSIASAMYNQWRVTTEPTIGLSPSTSSMDPSIEPENHHSKSSSFDLTWLEELPPIKKSAVAGISIPSPTFADFKYLGRLGNGAFAKVFCAEHLPSKRRVAIKVVDGQDEQARQQIEIEKQILFRYGHKNPYMIKAYCTFHKRNKLFLVMELVEGGSLFQKIQKTRMNEEEIRFYLAEILCVIQFLHSNNIVYRDLKLEHAIVCSEGHVRLVDFGLGRLLKNPGDKCHTVCGTYGYMAPEVWSLDKGPALDGYSFPVDYWALGVVLIQMLFGEQFDLHPHFNSFTENDTISPMNIAQNLQFPSHISPEAQACATALLEEDPEKRLGSPESPHGSIRNHAFFKAGRSINWQEIEESVFKTPYKSQSSKPYVSNIYSDQSIMEMSVVREGAGEADWMAAGHATITTPKDDQFTSFDYVDQKAWSEFIREGATSTAVTSL